MSRVPECGARTRKVLQLTYPANATALAIAVIAKSETANAQRGGQPDPARSSTSPHRDVDAIADGRYEHEPPEPSGLRPEGLEQRVARRARGERYRQHGRHGDGQGRDATAAQTRQGGRGRVRTRGLTASRGRRRRCRRSRRSGRNDGTASRSTRQQLVARAGRSPRAEEVPGGVVRRACPAIDDDEPHRACGEAGAPGSSPRDPEESAKSGWRPPSAAPAAYVLSSRASASGAAIRRPEPELSRGPRRHRPAFGGMMCPPASTAYGWARRSDGVQPEITPPAKARVSAAAARRQVRGRNRGSRRMIPSGTTTASPTNRNSVERFAVSHASARSAGRT